MHECLFTTLVRDVLLTSSTLQNAPENAMAGGLYHSFVPIAFPGASLGLLNYSAFRE